jgi:hypothetical protein
MDANFRPGNSPKFEPTADFADAADYETVGLPAMNQGSHLPGEMAEFSIVGLSA